MVTIARKPFAQLGPRAQERLVSDLVRLVTLGVAVAHQQARIDEASQQRQHAARQVIDDGAATREPPSALMRTSVGTKAVCSASTSSGPGCASFKMRSASCRTEPSSLPTAS